MDQNPGTVPSKIRFIKPVILFYQHAFDKIKTKNEGTFLDWAAEGPVNTDGPTNTHLSFGNEEIFVSIDTKTKNPDHHREPLISNGFC